MNKNKIVSILLLIVVLLLALIIGLFFSYKSIATQKNIEGFFSPNFQNNTYKDQNEENPTILNDHLQNIYFFMTLFYTNEPNQNIYTKIIKNNTKCWYGDKQWYTIYQTNKLLGDISDININKILDNTNDFYYDSNLSINYNIKNGDDFKNYIKKLYNTLTRHSLNQLVYGTISNDYLQLAPYTELVEIMYVSNFLPAALYDIYIMPFNEILVNYSGAIDNYQDYISLQQLYSCASQMRFSKNYISDKNGKLIDYVNFVQPYVSEHPAIQQFIESIMYIFKSPNYVSVLEPSFIMFYQALMYFAFSYDIASDYTSTYNYTMVTTQPPPITTRPITTRPITTPPITTPPITTVPKTTVPITTPPFSSCTGTLFSGKWIDRFKENYYKSKELDFNLNRYKYENNITVYNNFLIQNYENWGDDLGRKYKDLYWDWPDRNAEENNVLNRYVGSEFIQMKVYTIDDYRMVDNNGNFIFKEPGDYEITLNFSQIYAEGNGQGNEMYMKFTATSKSNVSIPADMREVKGLGELHADKGSVFKPYKRDEPPNCITFICKANNVYHSYPNSFAYFGILSVSEASANNDYYNFYFYCSYTYAQICDNNNFNETNTTTPPSFKIIKRS
jgi:hypothetical protein